MNIIHCDLKPENILLCDPLKSSVRVIDFGSSCETGKCKFNYIQSRFYRSPEVFLNLRYTNAIDMWSLGCILMELHTGEPLFYSSNVHGQFQNMVNILGMIPSHLIESSSPEVQSKYFLRGQMGWSLKPAPQEGQGNYQQQYHQSYSISDVRRALAFKLMHHRRKNKQSLPSENMTDLIFSVLFVDLLSRMLVYDPQKRISPDEALRHPFITEEDDPHLFITLGDTFQFFSSQC